MRTKLTATAETIRTVIAERKPASMTQLAHLLGYRGSVSSTVTRKFRQLVPEIGGLLAANGAAKDDKTPVGKGQAKPAAKGGRRWPRHPKNPYREGSAYATCVDILAAHKGGMPKEKLVELLAKASKKDLAHAIFDSQVVCSAWGNEPGLNPFDGPRNRSARPGYFVRRTNGHVQIFFE